MYGNQTAGMFGYSHFTGGFAGGQAEYVRVPFGDVKYVPASGVVFSTTDEMSCFLRIDNSY